MIRKRTWAFVIGPPCSGRDCVENYMLNMHPDAMIMGHTDLPLCILDAITSIGDRGLHRRWSLQVSDMVSGMMSNRDFGMHRLMEEGVSPFIMTRMMCEEIWGQCFPDKLVFGDSSQTYCFRHPDLTRIFPDAKLIVVHRDRSVNLSEYYRQATAYEIKMGREILPELHDKVERKLDDHLNAMMNVRGAFHLSLAAYKEEPIRGIRSVLDFLGLSMERFDMIDESVREIVRYKHLDCVVA